MKKFVVALVVAVSLIAGATAAGGIGYIWGGNGSTIGVNIPGGSYDKDDTLTQYQSWAMTAFQEQLYTQGWLSYGDWATEQGTFGPKTKIAVHYFQQVFLDNHTDAQTPDGLANVGRIGPATSKALFQPLVTSLESWFGVASHRLHGIIRVESNYDPGAYNSGGDRGILQFSPGGYPDISSYEAIAEATERINQMAQVIYDKYVFLTNRWGSAIGTSLRWSMASATWNAPTGSTQWSDCYVFTGDVFQNCGHSEVGVARYYAGAVGTAGGEYPN